VVRLAGICLLLAGCFGITLPTSASAKPPPSYQRRQIAHFVQDIFERFFFKTWLGEPMSLSGSAMSLSGACPESQIREALQQRGSFPEAFRRRDKDPRISSEYCGAVAVQLTSPGNMSFVLTIPVSNTCAQYQAQWEAFASEEIRSVAVQPYAISDATYAKFSITEQSRSIYRQTAPYNLDQSTRFDRHTLGQLRIIESTERDGVCRIVFSFGAASK
jgi:hypothetical protein